MILFRPIGRAFKRVVAMLLFMLIRGRRAVIPAIVLIAAVVFVVPFLLRQAPAGTRGGLGNSFEQFGRQSRIVKAIAEPARFLPQFIIMIAPIKTDAVDIRKSSGVPWPKIRWLRRIRADAGQIFSYMQIRLA